MGVEVDGSCAFELPVAETRTRPWLDGGGSWELSTDEDGVGDGVWHCPHDAVGGDRCVFHTERPPEGTDRSRALEEAVERANASTDPRERTRRCQFLGATFEELDLERAVVGGGSRETIDLRYADLGVVACAQTRFAQPVRFSGASFDPGAWPGRAPGSAVLDPTLEQVPFAVDFTETTFTDAAYFQGACFVGRPCSARRRSRGRRRSATSEVWTTSPFSPPRSRTSRCSTTPSSPVISGCRPVGSRDWSIASAPCSAAG
jgi:hypothetical protein